MDEDRVLKLAPEDGFAVYNGTSILTQTFSYRKSQSWDMAVASFDRMFDDALPARQVPLRPFGIVGRGEYPRRASRDLRVAWLRRRGCWIVRARIMLVLG